MMCAEYSSAPFEYLRKVVSIAKFFFKRILIIETRPTIKNKTPKIRDKKFLVFCGRAFPYTAGHMHLGYALVDSL
jgi:hypothetical protein